MQPPQFRIDGEAVTPTLQAASRLVTELAKLDRHGPASTAAAKIREAMQLGNSSIVDLESGDDTAVLVALDSLSTAASPLEPTLQRLRRALQRKIGAESGAQADPQ